MNRRQLALAAAVLLAAVSRLAPHPPNATPIAALALFGGAYLRNWKAAFGLPLAAMLLSDLVLGLTVYGKAILASQPVVYVSFVAIVAIGRLICDRRSVVQVAVAALTGSVLFFVVTNFAVWATETLYPRNWAGLMACYTAAVPYFRNTLLGDLAFTAILFGGFALLETLAPSLRERALAPVGVQPSGCSPQAET